MYIAHKREDGTTQSLLEHQTNVSILAAHFARPFCAQKEAMLAGLFHDAGKYSIAGQKRMNDPEHSAKVDHSTAGVKIVYSFSAPAAFSIAGHHAGIPDMGSPHTSLPGSSELFGRIKKQLSGELDYCRCWEELPKVSSDQKPFSPPWLDVKDSFSAQFYARMLYSCLVDADYLDTEAFMNGSEEKKQEQPTTMEVLHERFQPFILNLLSHPSNDLNRLRSDILQCCIRAAEKPSGIFTLTVPTGGGKTVSSMAYALEHAVRYHKKRIIYVAPYTSIIEQNASVYKRILGEENVLEHQSNALFWQQNDEQAEKSSLAAENWDAPIIVTTAVQFFESLFACTPSKCRKLHNISDSVIIFDEAQMLPLPFLIPCISAISELIRHYGVTAVLCTATQPALNDLFNRISGLIPVEICEPNLQNASIFCRVTYHLETEHMNEELLAQKLLGNHQILCIVNSRLSAQRVFDFLPTDGSKYHLSTNMTPRHRKKVLAVIRERLSHNLPCRVVSTSLIEAGVDVDFPAVYREIAGLDSILQAGGRCNREGKRNPAESVVTVFRLSRTPPKMFNQQIASTEYVVSKGCEIHSNDSISEYFHFLLNILGEEPLDEHRIMDSCRKYAFRQIGQSFHLIDDDTVSVYIPNQENAEDVFLLKSGRESRKTMRRLEQDAVNIYRSTFESFFQSGYLALSPNGHAILSDLNLYDSEKGLCPANTCTGNAFFL